jgi:hypothetical protein
MQSVVGYGGPGDGGQYAGTPVSSIAYDANSALAAAQNNLQRVIAPQLAQDAIASGSNPLSGAYAEALTNAAAGMALPITQQVMQNQQSWFNPQLQGTIQGGLGSQQAGNQLLSQGLGGGIQGALGSQAASNALITEGYRANQENRQMSQAAQNEILKMGYGSLMTGDLAKQATSNQFLAAQQGAGLRAMEQQGQNQFQAAMASPQLQNQMITNMLQAYGGQMGLAGLDKEAQQKALLNTQDQWNRAMAAMAGTAYTSHGMATTTKTSQNPDWLGMAVGLGSAALTGFCWVADALYGEGSAAAQSARLWVSEGWEGDQADSFREWYTENGKAVAQALIHHSEFCEAHEDEYRDLFDTFVMHGRRYQREQARYAVEGVE